MKSKILFISLASLLSANVLAIQVKVGAVSAPSRYLQANKSADDAVAQIKLAHADGVKILSFPETFIGGYPLWNYVEKTIDIAKGEKHKAEFIKGAIDLNGKEIQKIKRAAKKYNMGVIMTANLRGDKGNRNQVYNAIIFIDEHGKVLNVHRKTSASHTERQYWTAGDAVSIKNVLMHGLQVSAVQCWEARNPLTVSQLALNAPDVIFLPTQDFYQEEIGGSYQVEMRYIGRNAHAYVLSSSIMFDWKNLKKGHPELVKEWRTIMHDAPMLFPGGASIAGPDGKILKTTKPFESKILTTVVDTDKIQASMALHSITDSYRLKGDYTIYVGGKKLSGNGADSIY